MIDGCLNSLLETVHGWFLPQWWLPDGRHRGRCCSGVTVKPTGATRLCGYSIPGRDSLVTAASRIVPGTGQSSVIVGAERALEVGRGIPLPGPDLEGVPFELVDVVDGVARVGVETRHDVRARLGTERPFVADDLDARDPLAFPLPEVDAQDEEGAALHPLVGHRPSHVPGHLPGADEPLQAPEIWVRLGRPPVSLSVGVVVLHDGLSFRC
jgi:hypothetical protein